jgi:hypothetical protein
MAFENLPGIFSDLQDGSIVLLPANENPIVLVLGTATKGPSETLHRVERISTSASTFGKDREATLVRGMYEASVAGAQNLRLFRFGATPAVLANVGGTGAFRIETVQKDDSAGSDFKLFYDSSTQRLRVYRASDDEVVWDNNPAYPTEAIDLGEVAVTGTAGAGGSIGSSATPITLAAASGVSGAVFTAGTDGTDLSRMETYEALYNAYQLLSDQRVEVVVPMNVYLDDLNVMDLTGVQVSNLGLHLLSNYPEAGASNDALGLVYVEEYEGKNYFWWKFPTDPNNPTLGAGAQIYPAGVGSASATLKTDGSALAISDFHEVNFAYQLADFCYRQSNQNQEMTGVIGVLPPDSLSLKDVSRWVGKLPVTSTDANGNVIITSNGTGLLGNKFMCGRKAQGNVPGFTVDGVQGLFNGGFIATDTGWLDDAQQEDSNEHLIDIGKYLSVVATYPILSNPSRTAAYSATGAGTYGGFYAGLPASSAPTNKVLTSVRLPYRISTAKLDLLAGQRYVTFHAKTKGIVVSDAPTAARPDSDYRRLSTVRIVKQTIDDVREAGEPFLGEGISGARLAALDTAVDRKLGQRVKDGSLVRYEHKVISTPDQRVLGQCTIELKLVPAFELRQITVVVGLAAI